MVCAFGNDRSGGGDLLRVLGWMLGAFGSGAEGGGGGGEGGGAFDVARELLWVVSVPHAVAV